MNKIIAGAKEALAIARGEKMPAKVTAFGWTTWSPQSGLGNFIYGDENIAKGCSGRNDKIVRVRIETV